MANWCLPQQEAAKFKNAIRTGLLNPQTLAGMTSADRRAELAKHFGEPLAARMNLELEKRLILKNQLEGMKSWVKKMMAHDVPKRDSMIARVAAIREYLTPADITGFMADLVAAKLGTEITPYEAQRIADLSQAVEDAKEAFDNGTGDRLAYGRAAVDLRNYISELKHDAHKLRMREIPRSPVEAVKRAAQILADTSKSIAASMDDSAIGRQGWKVLFTHGGVWRNNALKSFSDLVRASGADVVMNEVDADIMSRPTYDLMRRAKLAVGTEEEFFPSELPGKIPGVGRAYRASEHAFAAFQRKTRADVFDKYIEIAMGTFQPRRYSLDALLKRVGMRKAVELDQDQLESIGRLVNSLTARGDMGMLERIAKPLNWVFFSPRMVKSHIDTLLLHPLGRGVGGWGDRQPASFAQKEAALNLLKIIMGISLIIAIARALKPDSVDLNPLSTDFGQIKIRNTRFDMTGGMRSLVTLAARLIMNESKNTSTGVVYPLNKRYNRTEVLLNFGRNKLSPIASVVADLWSGDTREGNKPTFLYEAIRMSTPIPFQTFMQLQKDPNSANKIVVMIADALGIGTTDYSPK